ncbi:acyloxyacyl hydrolase [Aliivibrio sp. EL58]|uniref:acyloxyacyl hydrolase n=1 Tax=Aliivibrio sp. EL58 TaxID=2107582 RepID=UPI001C1F5F8F|nr:acyloxyacyl hydrolase [Aliivibrio sp. EL58]
MKKLLLIFIIIYSNNIRASNNQLMIYTGQSSRSSGLEELYTVKLQYSQPNEFFRIPGRRNIEAGFFAFGEHESNLDENNQFIAGLSQDLYLLNSPFLYAGAGLGGYIKSKSTERISSKVTFGQKVFIGVNVNRVNIEAYFRHYSNGTLTNKNAGQNFVGLAVGYYY